MLYISPNPRREGTVTRKNRVNEPVATKFSLVATNDKHTNDTNDILLQMGVLC